MTLTPLSTHRAARNDTRSTYWHAASCIPWPPATSRRAAAWCAYELPRTSVPPADGRAAELSVAEALSHDAAALEGRPAAAVPAAMQRAAAAEARRAVKGLCSGCRAAVDGPYPPPPAIIVGIAVGASSRASSCCQVAGSFYCQVAKGPGRRHQTRLVKLATQSEPVSCTYRN
jgi:hypothetical protein